MENIFRPDPVLADGGLVRGRRGPANPKCGGVAAGICVS